ncbi:MAG: hypothetical protein HZB41_07335 [Ignavibacteriae bacterium]|nr:hypothetical protein [Ignavibacteriota bacterium]
MINKYFYYIFLLVNIFFITCCNQNLEPVDSRTNIEGVWLVQFYKDFQYKLLEKDTIVKIIVKDNILYWNDFIFDNLQFFNNMVNTMSTDNQGWTYHLAITMKTNNSFDGSWGEMKINDNGGLYSDTKYVKGDRK